MTAKLIDSGSCTVSQVTEDVKGVDLELNKLWLRPSGKNHVCGASFRIQKQEKSLEKVVLESKSARFL